MHPKQRIAIVIGLVALACFGVLAGLVVWLGTVTGVTVGLVTAIVVLVAYFALIGPWQRRWGATDDEVHRNLPGDDLLGLAASSTTRAITVDVSPEDVFPWLMQLGYGRGGWYSYDWIDNDGQPSIERIDPALQQLAVGDRIEMLPGMGPVVRDIEPNHHIVSAGDADSWCLLVEPTSDGKTRLISRWRQHWPRSVPTMVWIALSDPGAFVMEQKMLRRIRDLAQRRDAQPRVEELTVAGKGRSS